jgi:RNA polymerase sigma-70 factor (ECF subfamily)
MAIRPRELEFQHELEATTEVSVRAADAVLVRAFQEGDPLAFPAIYERYRPLARHIALKILGNVEEADEASQETMLRVYQGLQRFDGELLLKAWVARIASNLALDGVRARARRPARADRPVEIEAASMPDPAQDPEALVARMLEDAEVRKVLATLPPHYRDALVMRDFEGRSHVEIGQVLGVSAPQAKALLHRARRSFRQAWEAASTGVAGVVPFLFGPFKRLFGEHAADATATATAATQAAAVHAAPTLSLVPQVAQTAATSGMAERIAAAGMAVLVAAGVGAGAVAVKKTVDRPAKPVIAATAPAAPGTALTQQAKADKANAEQAAADGATADTGANDGAGLAAGSDQATPIDPATGAPVVDPTAPVTDPIIAVSAGLPVCDGCSISWALSPDPTNGAVVADSGTTTFSYALLGTVTGEGSEGWSATASIGGRVAGSEGTAEVVLSLTSPDGTAIWTGSTLLAASPDGSGFDVQGSYTLLGAPEAMVGVPTFGDVSGRLVLTGGSLARLFLGLA